MAETKDQIVALADTLIKSKGYNAFSYKDISDALQIKNAAIHYYFPSKTDLGVSVIEHNIRGFEEHHPKWKHLPEEEQLGKLFEVFKRNNRAGLICLNGSLTPDYDTLPEAMQKKVHEMSNGILSWVTETLESGRTNQRFHFEGPAYERALIVISVLISSLLLSRVLGGKTYDRMTTRILKDLISIK